MVNGGICRRGVSPLAAFFGSIHKVAVWRISRKTTHFLQGVSQ